MRYGRRAPVLASVHRQRDNVTSALIVYTSSSRWDFIIVPMSSTVTEGKKERLGQKAAMGGAIKNHGLPQQPLAGELRKISAIDERVGRNLR